MRNRWRQRFRSVIQPSQLHTLLKGEVGCSKKRLDKVDAFNQQSLDDVDVHFVAVSANRVIAVYVSVTVDEVIHIAAIPLTINHYILKIEFSRFGKQLKQFLCYILFSSKVGQVLLLFKKREDFLLCSFMSINLLYSFNSLMALFIP